MTARVESLRRSWAEFVGPEATRANNTLAVSSGIIGLFYSYRSAKRAGAGRFSQTALGALALDLFGGAYVNNTRACVRWYERAGQGAREHCAFAALHVHPLIVGAVDQRIGERSNGVSWASAHYGYMMLATAITRSCPSRRRSLGAILTVGGLLLDHALRRSAVAPWFAWTYYPKLLLGHAAGSLWPDEDLGVEHFDSYV
ncbi:hypothetical protein LSI54_11415 [Nesterenkonia sp. AY15]|uniref:hypothetical protein n=1 Tax=Nesterenkonia sp. AY15 TaxID=2901139 RepID=UPI001F4CBDE2|nr:hypothetical protein [Nesterenkonia sp. AY15]MCH8571959.1 hypothetical protein [Nesterenkonia sp. AY15]